MNAETHQEPEVTSAPDSLQVRAKKGLKKALLVSAASKIVGFLLQFVTMPWVLNVLQGKLALFGAANSLLGTVNTLNLGNGPGLLVILSKVEESQKDEECDWFWSSWWTNLLFATLLHSIIVLLLIAAPPTLLFGSAFSESGRAVVDVAFLATGLSFASSLFLGIDQYYTARLQDFKGRLGALATFSLQILLLVSFLQSWPSVFLVTLALLGATLLVRPIQAIFFFRDFPHLWRGFRWLKVPESKQLLAANLAATVYMLSEMAWMAGATRILGETTKETVALATILLGIARVGGTIPEMILAPMVPAVRKTLLEGQTAWPRRVVIKSLGILTAFSAGLALLGLVAAQPVLSIMFPDYEITWPIAMSALALGLGLLFEGAARNLVNVTADLWWFGYVSLGKAALQVVLMLAWLGPYGLAGVLNALALGAFAFFLVTLIRFRFEARRIAASALAAEPG